MNSKQDRAGVVRGKCLTCYYLTFRNGGETFVCAKWNFEQAGMVESCPGYKPIAEGLAELVKVMKARGELEIERFK